MNTARWLVILSVIFCMIAVLTVLQRSTKFSGSILSQKHEEVVENNSNDRDGDVKIIFKRPSIVKYETNSIEYSKPPRQIFEMDTNQDIQSEDKQIKTEGQIID